MVNYGNGKVYKIESHLGDKIYYGSTTKKYLSQRMDKHRNEYKRWLEGKTNLIMSYKMFEQYGIENCKIILIENCSCESKDELTAREAYYIRNFDCVNKVVPGRTDKEYQVANKDRRKEYLHQNKEKIQAQTRNYRETNKYNIKEQKRRAYEKNKDIISEQRKEKYNCECGSVCCRGAKSRHEKSKIHLNFINSQ